MSFDLERFRAAPCEPRQAQVPVPDLAFFFGDGEDPVWTVRGLTGEEIAAGREARRRSERIASAVEALAGAAASKGETVEAIQTMLGYGPDVPADLAQRHSYLVAGSVEPRLDRAAVVRLFAGWPVVGYQLTDKILELTGMGPDLGKAQHSTPTPESESA